MYQAPRGTADILPEEQPYWYHIEKKAREICSLFGYKQIKTPVFEDVGLFNRSVGEGTDLMDKEIYVFEDRGNNKLALMPEGTAGVCRAYVEHGMQNLPQPVKVFYITPIFRYDRPQAGRYRLHYQFGCEAIGDGSPAVDSEIIDLLWNFYRSLGLTDIRLVMNSIGCRTCRPVYLEKLVNHYRSNTGAICQDCKTRLEKNPMRLLDCKNESCQPIAETAPKSIDYLCEDCRKHLADLEKYLGILGIPYTINHRLVRGLDYYTRTVFEVQPANNRSQSSIGGGGRYDHLVEAVGGKPAPAAGFAAGIERIILNMKEQGITVPDIPSPRVYCACMGEAAADLALHLASELRKAGVGTILASANRSLKAQLRHANSTGAEYTVIIGEDEVTNGTAVLRDMKDAGQVTMALDELKKTLIDRCASR
ncbi:MAG: histidine--tRNA ligase [Dehalococcoidales bacterium]|nr:histidine--tRNA ligase [Dehalococcoidales bacterium]